MGSAASNPSRHPILGDRKFPHFNEGPLSTIEKLPSKQKYGIINNKVRLAVKAVQPGRCGRGINRHWVQMVQSKDLKSSTSLTVVGNRSTFSLEMFLPWKKFHMILARGLLQRTILFQVAGPSSRLYINFILCTYFINISR